MENSQSEILCPVCNKQVSLREDTCADEHGKTVHTDCYVNQILKDKASPAIPAAIARTSKYELL